MQKKVQGIALNPTDWGWVKEEGQLAPVTSTRPPAPAKLLELVSCECVAGCSTANCSFKIKRLECTTMCGFCAGHGCSNSYSLGEDEDPVGDLEPISLPGKGFWILLRVGKTKHTCLI